MAARREMLVPVVLEDVHGKFVSTEELAAAVVEDATLLASAFELRDRRAAVPDERIDIGDRAIFEKLTRRNAARFIHELRARLSVELNNDAARILAARVVLGSAPEVPLRSEQAAVVDLASWKLSPGSAARNGGDT